jgi:hypothetical protein
LSGIEQCIAISAGDIIKKQAGEEEKRPLTSPLDPYILFNKHN